MFRPVRLKNFVWRLYLRFCFRFRASPMRSKINPSHRATYCCVFWSRFYLKILVGREKSKTKIITENALEYLASWDDLKMDRIGDARIFGVAKTEWERAFTMLSHDKNNLWCKSKTKSWRKSKTMDCYLKILFPSSTFYHRNVFVKPWAE